MRINPTRDGILRVCRAMGADITLLNETTEGEPTADLLIRSSALHGTTIEGAIIPTLIDELPMIAVMAALQKEPLLSGMHRSFVSKSPTASRL